MSAQYLRIHRRTLVYLLDQACSACTRTDRTTIRHTAVCRRVSRLLEQHAEQAWKGKA